MRLRRMLVALFAVTALAAVAAGAAQAAPQWMIKGDNWTTTETVKAEKHPGTTLVFHSELLGLKVTVTANQVACEGCTITKGGVASAGKLKFTGVTVDINEVASPTCSVNGGTVTTEALKDNLKMVGTTTYDVFEPATAGGKFVTLTFAGAECPLNEASASVTGTACGESAHTEPAGTWVPNVTGKTPHENVNPTKDGTFEVQSLVFGNAQQTAGGCSLLLGKKEAQLTGAVDNRLSGPNETKLWGAGE